MKVLTWLSNHFAFSSVGHVIAARITSENPDEGFKPSAGTVHELNFKSNKNVWGYFSVSASGGLHEFAGDFTKSYFDLFVCIIFPFCVISRIFYYLQIPNLGIVFHGAKIGNKPEKIWLWLWKNCPLEVWFHDFYFLLFTILCDFTKKNSVFRWFSYHCWTFDHVVRKARVHQKFHEHWMVSIFL